MRAFAHGGCTDIVRESASAPRASYDAKNDVCVLFCERECWPHVRLTTNRYSCRLVHHLLILCDPGCFQFVCCAINYGEAKPFQRADPEQRVFVKRCWTWSENDVGWVIVCTKNRTHFLKLLSNPMGIFKQKPWGFCCCDLFTSSNKPLQGVSFFTAQIEVWTVRVLPALVLSRDRTRHFSNRSHIKVVKVVHRNPSVMVTKHTHGRL